MDDQLAKASEADASLVADSDDAGASSTPKPVGFGDELVEGFYELFQGNPDAYGTDHGSAKHLDMGDRDTWLELIEAHLSGEEPIGIYPCSLRSETEVITSGADVETKVKWGCVDLDSGYQESWPDALNVHNVLKAVGITSWIERSRSKGWHIWCFCTDWVAASTMRDALWAACELVDAPTTEVNPKQTDVSDGKLGNYVRLPYPGWMGEHGAETDAQRMVLPEQHEIELYTLPFFVSEALAGRCTPAQLQALAARRQQHDRHTSIGAAPDTPIQLDETILRKLDGLSFTILQDGPGAGTEGDRSATLFKLGATMWESGRLTEAESWAVMVEADSRWGKYQSRDGDTTYLWSTFRKSFCSQPGGTT